jgi:RNA polymerase sigma factor (sigma-70 family)
MSVPSPFSQRSNDELIQVVAHKNQNGITDTKHPFYQDAMLAIFVLRNRPPFNWRVMNIMKSYPEVPEVDRDEIIDRVWEGVEKNFRYGNSSMFLAYVTTTARNKRTDYFKSLRVQTQANNVDPDELGRPPEGLDEDQRQQIRDCVEKLRAHRDGRLHDVLRMRHLGEKGYDEIYAELKIPPKRAYSLLHRAMQQVRDCLTGKGFS